MSRRAPRHGDVGVVCVSFLLVVGCRWSDDFVCGTRIGTSEKTRICDHYTGEVCVCAVGACAKPDRTCLGGSSHGFRYREVPFAPGDLAGRCVGELDAESAIDQVADDQLSCSPSDLQTHMDAGSWDASPTIALDATPSLSMDAAP